MTCHLATGILLDRQSVRCNGYGGGSPFSVPEGAPIISRGAGGQDNIENVQLLYSHCNRVKRDRPQKYLVARLRELGMAL